jgi:uncharacterized protein YlxW (UPF0749 family)
VAERWEQEPAAERSEQEPVAERFDQQAERWEQQEPAAERFDRGRADGERAGAHWVGEPTAEWPEPAAGRWETEPEAQRWVGEPTAEWPGPGAAAGRWDDEDDDQGGAEPEESDLTWDNERVAAAQPGVGASAEEPEDGDLVAVGGREREESEAGVSEAKRKRISGAGLVIGVLLALLGFSLVVQVKSNSTDAAYASAREGDLLQIMSDLDGAESRLEQDIASLEAAKRELASGAAGQEAAQAAAKERADDMGILAGTLPAQGPGVQVVLTETTGTIKAASLLNAVQELRGGGAEAILIDATGGSVRVIASTSFVDDNGGINVDGTRLTGPYTILAIGEPDTLSDAVQFAGGVVPRVKEDGGNVIVNKRDVVEIKQVRPAPDLEYARPAS